MALVRVRWNETQQYEAEVEVDGYDPDGPASQVLEAIGDLSSEAFDDAQLDHLGTEVLEREVVREGELHGTVDRHAPAHEPDWED